jgi:RimJ/RimL family protein N-acetyltransferase
MFVEFNSTVDISLLENHQIELSNVTHMRYSQQSKIKHSLESTEDYITKLVNSGGKFYFLKQISDELVVGSITIKPINAESAEIGIFIYEKFSNLGLGTEAFHMVRTVLIQMGFKVMIAGTKINHFAMRRIFEKTGMVVVTSRNFLNDRFVELDHVYFGIKLI